MKFPKGSFWYTTVGIAILTGATQAPALEIAPSSQSITISPALQASIATHQQKIAATLQRQQLHANAITVAAANVALGGGGFANPSRAYPPSCLADGLPYAQAATDPNAKQGTLTLSGYDSSAITETDTFTVFRVPCSGNTSATLLEIDRPSTATASSYVYFPDIYLTSSTGVQYPPRLPQDANTVYSDTPPLGVMSFSSIYVLEYYAGDTVSSAPNFNSAFTLSIGDVVTGQDISLNVPAYSSSTFNYPSATNPLEISGYVSGPWYDTSHSGEGLLIQVYDNGDQTNRTFAATWYTFDNLGIPFWLVAQAVLPIQGTASGVTNGYQVVNAPVTYVTGGGFAGNFTSPVTNNNWGTMSFSFQDCNTLNFSYSGATGANINSGPAGSGTKQWTRLASASGLVCQ